jgi:hypothetical protein
MVSSSNVVQDFSPPAKRIAKEQPQTQHFMNPINPVNPVNPIGLIGFMGFIGLIF